MEMADRKQSLEPVRAPVGAERAARSAADSRAGGTGRGKWIALVVALVAVTLVGGAAWRSWQRVRFWWLFQPLGKNVQGYPEFRHRSTGILFVRVPGGSFWMGAQKEDPNRQNYDPQADDCEGPVHEVDLSPFLIGKYEVTQAEWERAMGSNPSESRGADLPVAGVSWGDCQEFCRKTGLGLPSETQWECACRAGTTGPYGGTGRLDDMAWYDGNSGLGPHPIGQKQPNGFGLHDMIGNVREWCEDEWSYYGASESWTDPARTSGSGSRVHRGGDWGTGGDCRCAHRTWSRSGLSLLGFRAVASAYP